VCAVSRPIFVLDPDSQRITAIAPAARVADPIFWEPMCRRRGNKSPFFFAVAPTSRAEIYLGPGQVAQLHGAPALYRLVQGRRVASKMLLSVDDSVFLSMS